MTLDEAIKQAEERADLCEYEASRYDMSDSYENYVAYQESKCAKEQRQIAEWLKELKKLKEQIRWIPISDDTLPEPCTEVQVTCEVRYSDGMKHKYQSIAQWIPKNCEEALRMNWDMEATEYNEEKDEYYPLEGWYESIKNWDEFSLVAISDFVIAWKPLPEPYKEKNK